MKIKQCRSLSVGHCNVILILRSQHPCNTIIGEFLSFLFEVQENGSMFQITKQNNKYCTCVFRYIYL